MKKLNNPVRTASLNFLYIRGKRDQFDNCDIYADTLPKCCDVRPDPAFVC